jgi:hypothetical protein
MDINFDKLYRLSEKFGNKIILNPIETDLYDCAHRLANVLIQEQETYSFKWTPSNTWIDSLTNHENPKIKKRIKIWLQQGKIGFRGRVKYLFWLANNDMMESRKFIIHLLLIDEPKPDLEYLLTNLTRTAYGISKAINWANFKADPAGFKNPTTISINKLVSSEEEFLRVLSLPDIDIPRMGGWRNTVVGWHEKDLDGVNLWTDSNAYFDLGGGHHTPWYVDKFNLPFTSLDLDPPWPTNGVVLRALVVDADGNQHLKTLTDMNLDRYERKLQSQNWIKWNMYQDQLPVTDQSKITFISSGFLTSTLTPPPEHLSKLEELTSKTNTVKKFKVRVKFQCMIGLLKILKLVYEGKSVELLTLSRPSKYHTKYRLCHIRWENQMMTYFEVTEHNSNATSAEFKEKRSSDIAVNIDNETLD